MTHTEPTGQWTEETAQWYADNYGNWPTTRMPLDAVEWRGEETVVDLGCGTGNSLRYLATLCPTGRLVGIEPTPAMLAIARHQTDDAGLSDRIDLQAGAAESIPAPDNSVDTVLAFSTYLHWQDIDSSLVEIARVLKPGGRLLLSEEPENLNMHNTTLAEIESRLSRAGLSVVTTQQLNDASVVCELIIAKYLDPVTKADT